MSSEVAAPPAKRPWKRIVAMAALAGGAAAIVATFDHGQKEPVSIHVSLSRGITELRMEIRRETKLMEHLEWAYHSSGAHPSLNCRATSPLRPRERRYSRAGRASVEFSSRS